MNQAPAAGVCLLFAIVMIIERIWPDKNAANVKQADLMFHFINGVSKDQKTNNLFSNISHYVQARESQNK